MCSGGRLSQCHRGIPDQRLVVVDAPLGVEHATVAVISELVKAQVGHHDKVVTDRVAHPAQADIEDALAIVGA